MRISPLQSVLDIFVGMPVSQTNLIGNELRIWFKYPGSDERAMSLITPVPWRLEHHGLIMTTSAEIPRKAGDVENPEEFKSRMEATRALLDLLVGKIVDSVSIDPDTRDLSLILQDGLLLRSFTVWRDDEMTVVHFYAENRRIALTWDGISESPINHAPI